MLDVDVLDKVVSDIERDFSVMKKSLEMTAGSMLAEDGSNKKDVLSDEIVSLKDRIDNAQKELAPLREEVASLDAQVTDARRIKDLALKREQEFNRLNERAVGKKERIRSLDARNAEILTEILGLRNKMDEMGALGNAHREYQVLVERKQEIEKDLQAYEEKRNLERSLTESKKKISEISAEISTKKETLLTSGDVEGRLRKIEDSLGETDDHASVVREEIGLHRSELKRISKEVVQTKAKIEQISTLGPESPCPTCERPLRDHQKIILEKLSDEIKEREEQTRTIEGSILASEKELEQLRLRKEMLEKRKMEVKKQQKEWIRATSILEQLSLASERLDEERERLEARLDLFKDRTYDEGELISIRARITELKNADDRYNQLQIETQRIPKIEEELETSKSQIADVKSDLAKIEGEIAVLGYNENESQRAQASYEDLLHLRESRTRELLTKEAEIRLDQRELQIREEQLREFILREKSIDELTARMQQLTALSSVMKEFRANVMSRIIPTLSGISSTLLVDLTDSKYGGMELDEDYEIQVLDGGMKYPLSRFSGGEGDLANLCLRLAISRVIADRSGSNVDFLILDEIFGSQDQTRKRNIMLTLNQLAKQFRQIILITHIEDVKDFMENVINVKEREDGTSEVIVEV
jgi:exonuclease SbcC